MESLEILYFIFSKVKLATQNSNDLGNVWHDNKRISATLNKFIITRHSWRKKYCLKRGNKNGKNQNINCVWYSLWSDN